MQLKDYQKETLATLARFFRDARIGGPKVAYEAIVNEPVQKARLGPLCRCLQGARSGAAGAVCVPATADRWRKDFARSPCGRRRPR